MLQFVYLKLFPSVRTVQEKLVDHVASENLMNEIPKTMNVYKESRNMIKRRCV